MTIISPCDQPFSGKHRISTQPWQLSASTTSRSSQDASPSRYSPLFSPSFHSQDQASEVRQPSPDMFTRAPEVKNTFETSALSLQRRLRSIEDERFAISTPSSVTKNIVTRIFIAQHYGGCIQSVFHVPLPEAVERHGHERFLCLHDDHSPYIPKAAGRSGLLLFPRTADGQWPFTDKLFVRIGPDRWRYFGDYDFTRYNALTLKEWKALPRSVNKYLNVKTLTECGVFRFRQTGVEY